MPKATRTVVIKRSQGRPRKYDSLEAAEEAHKDRSHNYYHRIKDEAAAYRKIKELLELHGFDADDPVMTIADLICPNR